MIKHHVDWPLLAKFVVRKVYLHPQTLSPADHSHLDLDGYLRAVGLPLTAAARKCVIDQVLAARNKLGHPIQSAFIVRGDKNEPLPPPAPPG